MKQQASSILIVTGTLILITVLIILLGLQAFTTNGQKFVVYDEINTKITTSLFDSRCNNPLCQSNVVCEILTDGYVDYEEYVEDESVLYTYIILNNVHDEPSISRLDGIVLTLCDYGVMKHMIVIQINNTRGEEY